MTPADAWRVTLGLKDGEPPLTVRPGALCEVRVGDDTVMTGRIDEYEHETSKRGHTLTISGRDGAAVLVDCSAPVFVKQQVMLDEIVAAIVRDLGVKTIRIDADIMRRRDKINIEPGDTAWDALKNAAEANGLWPWFAPNGTLVVGGPDYTKPAVATLVMRKNGDGNNLLSLKRKESIVDRFSKVTVYGQTHGTATERGKHNLLATVTDNDIHFPRPKIVIDHEADNTAIATGRARKIISDGRIRGFEFEAKVKGHRIGDDGPLWEPGQRVHLISEAHQTEGVFFLMARKFSGGREQGATTTLTLKEDGVWTLDAHPHKGKRRGKNSGPGVVVDVWTKRAP
jgi:prophage tail gpP-like protein